MQRLEHQHVQQAHAACALHRGDAIGLDARLADAAQHAGGGLHENGDLVGEIGGKRARRERRCPGLHQHVFGKAAGCEQVFLEGLAHGHGAAPAQRALTARDMMRNRDPIADTERLDTLAHAGDFAHQLVSEHRPRGCAAGFELEQIGSAKARHAQPEQELTCLRKREPALLQGNPIAAAADDDPVAVRN